MRPILHGKERLKDERNKAIHPTQKPEIICKDIILYYSNENDVILDPFCGSGTVPKVCIETNRKYIGIEKEEKYYQEILKRIGQKTFSKNKFFNITT